jgi:hypothetical protein
MYLVRDVFNCKPGKVRPLLEKFRELSKIMGEMGQEPMRLLTDVSGEPYWTLIAETRVENLEEFFAPQQEMMDDERVRTLMADYHDLVESGRREILRIEE